MSDYMIRATAANGQVRAFAATTRDLTEYARNAHNTSPVVTAAFRTYNDSSCHDGQHAEGR